MHHKRPGCCSRRHFLASQAMGIGGLALSWLLHEEGLAAQTKPILEKPTFDLKPKPPPAPPQAKAMISLWMQGGPSHVDLCDPKPELSKYDGKEIPGGLALKDDTYKQRVGKVLASPWSFKKHGQSGMDFSELLPHVAEVADDITLVRSMYSPTVNNHIQAIRAYQRADESNRLGNSDRPSLGSWITYALGSESQNLPAFVAMTDSGGLPVDGLENWTNGLLPPLYQGTVIRPREPRIVNLDAPPYLTGEPQQSALEFLERMNRRHLARHPGNDDLQARMTSFQLAARMQLAASEAMDISKESKETHRLYGLDDPLTRQYGANCLLARRLVERGVRFVQLYNGGQYWDHHSRIIRDLPACCRRTDKPAAALVKDLKRRGLLEQTIVHWGGEMGRLPVIQGNSTNRAAIGRDHNVYGFSMWLAGGGFKAGHVHGATDDFGFQAVEDRVGPADYLATIAFLFGLDHDRLTFEGGGGEQRLFEGPSGRVVGQLLERPAPA